MIKVLELNPKSRKNNDTLTHIIDEIKGFNLRSLEITKIFLLTRYHFCYNIQTLMYKLRTDLINIEK